MDDKDREILEQLMENGKARLSKIAKKAGLPLSTAHHRILRMEKEGIIRKYAALPDYRKTGLLVCAYVLINVDYSGISSQENVAREIRKIRNVEHADIVSGEIDIIAKVRGEDVETLGETVLKRIRNVKGVSKTVTSIVLRSAD